LLLQSIFGSKAVHPGVLDAAESLGFVLAERIEAKPNGSIWSLIESFYRSFILKIVFEMAAAEMRHTSLGPDPKTSISVGQKTDDGGVGQVRTGTRIPAKKAISVVTVQTVIGSDPKITVAVLRQRIGTRAKVAIVNLP
jgi:hypothetical protein